MRREVRALLELAQPRWRRYVVGVVALVATDLGNLTVPWLLGRFIDAAQQGRMNGAIALRYAGAVMGIALTIAFFRYLWRIFIFGTARLIDFDLRQRLFRHLLTLSADFYQVRKVGDLMAHAINDLQAVRTVLGEGVMAGFDPLITGSMALVAMAGMIDWRLTVVSLLPLPVLAIFEAWYGNWIHARFRAVQAAFSTLCEQVQENVSGIRVIKAFAQEEAAKRQFSEHNRAYRDRVLAMVRLSGLNEPVISLLSGTSILISLVYGGSLVLQGKLSLGHFIAFNSYLGMLVWPMMALGWVANLIQRGTASMARLLALFDTRPSVQDAPGAIAPPRVEGRLEIRDLTFRHAPDRPPVLEGITLTVEPGSTLGILGRMGSGKSTLANLLVRVYDPPAGCIFLDGHDLNDLTLGSLREAIGYVPQDGFLFSESVEANLGFAPRVHAPEDLQRVAGIVQLLDEIAAMPQGLATMLGERGITLSGGQRQRLGLGRALLKDPPILVLDDCLSAVDTITEARILAGLRPVMRQRTTILVSHRVSALQHADEIIVLERGRVIERGTPASLLAQEGEYRRIHDRQMLELSIAEGG